MDFKKASHISVPKRMNMLIYGDNTVGKTVCATTAPKPMLILDTDNRPQTYAGKEGIMYEIIENSGTTANGYRNLQEIFRYLSRENELEFETIVLDSTTSVLDLMIDDLLGLSGKGKVAHEGLDINHWGSIDERFRKMFGILKRLDCLTIVLSHDQIFQDGLTQEITYTAMRVGKKISKKAPGYFDEVYRAFVEKDRRTKEKSFLLQTQRTGRKYPARTSYNLEDEEGTIYPILEEIEPQNISAILEKLEWARNNPEEALKKIKRERNSKDS